MYFPPVPVDSVLAKILPTVSNTDSCRHKRPLTLDINAPKPSNLCFLSSGGARSVMFIILGNRRSQFKYWTKLFASHFVIIPLEKELIKLLLSSYG